jgi:hypothetical protein
MPAKQAFIRASRNYYFGTKFALFYDTSLQKVVRAMKKLADIVARWGPPATIEQTSDGEIWYYCFYTTNVGVSNGFFVNGIKRESGWWLGSIIADKEGNIIKVSKYWEQSDSREVQ